MKKLIILIIIVYSSLSVIAQDESVFTQYIINKTLVNPAFSGALNQHQVFLNVRNQWAGFPGAPKTYSLSYNGPIADKIGLGAMIFSENIAGYSKLRAQLSYAYHYKTRNLKMGLGFSTEVHRTKLSTDYLLTPLTITSSDPLLKDAADGKTYFDATVGAQALINDQIILGIALPTLIRARLNGVGQDTSQKLAASTFLGQINLIGGYRMKMQDLTLEPSLMIRKSYNAPLLVDFNLKASFLEDRILGGIMYRPSYAIAFMIGTKISQMQLLYTYEVSTQKFQGYSGGTHEITLGFDFEAKTESKSPRGRKAKN
jgi:type IX secretion system PorP/SprF family membrane protein